MNRLGAFAFGIILAVLAQIGDVHADGILNYGGSGGTAGFVTCSAGVCTFTGADGSTQMVVGTTNSAVDYLQVLGGVTGGGATMNCTSASDTNVACNFTAKGNGAVTFNNGHGNLGAFVDPGSSVSTNGGVQLTPSISNAQAKVGNSTYGVNLDCGTSTSGCQIAGLPLASEFPGYIVGNWYIGYNIGSFATGAAPGAGSIRLYPAFIMQRTTINALGARLSTASASGNFQLAIYANNPATNQPTGTALVSTTSISTTTTGSLNAAVSLQLSPGMYWFASNCDNATAAFTSNNQSAGIGSALFGSNAQNNSVGNGVGIQGVSVTQTFGTWPDLTSASFTQVAGSLTLPIVQFKIASVP